ncbi:dTDP-4-amino-4,6-dideoxygalactose transaminase [Thiobacillus sp.]|uniref:dTDP-4-amino-4,6-dideoxygalactose transaminase n=1 Tax=Thiobacillus sp. TaxID=924 RepID=UPI0018551DD6|nr:dTDP-4-amino-4,6-dideoxygalactose transaminase [Thiobacillus sp.]MBC2732263.1 dTDP-4-amino-4,6-dideoxygalactose transaminase [Thiobacillus sp.]MBC2741001.1 dTDP-4-amino-4,6-dideoxygalactose transaminase [Thiobacillus sp.]MBC2760049.1 dTDP-4-amino-4,6-dideoxygalactose transaminase [Thiobacillus sp.]
MSRTNQIIPFNWPYMTGKELYYIAEAHFNGKLAGDGPFTKKCHKWLEEQTGTAKALLTHSCTAALEMTALLLDLKPGDEVIMPSYTFVSTANAFVLRGVVPVFVDIRPDTLNIDETRIEEAITSRTRAIVPVHYAGVGCEMDVILDIANRRGLSVIEDAAQGLMASYKGQPLGAIGDFGAISFHETKNVISGEGGALLVNSARFAERSEIIREKGTDRSRFFRGQVDKYTWQEVGSSYLPGELIAAFLWAQMEEANEITARRMAIWNDYHGALQSIEEKGLIKRPTVPDHCVHNAHMYYVLMSDPGARTHALEVMKNAGINALFHYIPLHDSPAGKRFGRVSGEMRYTNSIAQRLIRLPLWVGLSDKDVSRVVDVLASCCD